MLLITNYVKIFKIYNLAIKCKEFIDISNSGSFKFNIIFFDIWEYREPIGFGTLVVYTLKHGYFDFLGNHKLTQKYPTWGV